jgi:hypothetical protein
MMRALLLIFLLSGCAADKVSHAVIGGSSYVFDDKCYLALGLGIAKELVDSRTHKPDAMDAAATYLGCWILRTSK